MYLLNGNDHNFGFLNDTELTKTHLTNKFKLILEICTNYVKLYMNRYTILQLQPK